MGLLTTLTAPLASFAASTSTPILLAATFFAFITVAVVVNVLKQLFLKNPNEPPVVFHWFPFIGSTITYGIHPYKFFENAREKYGDTFTFILLGTPTTVCLGTTGNDFILNAKLKDANAEGIYGQLTTPIFGKDVVYDCPNAKFMEQKKFVKFGLTSESLRSYVRLISQECQDYIKRNSALKGGQRGEFDVVDTMSELTLYSAARSLQGREVREKLDITFAHSFHDLDMGFSPINFMLPWAPLPHNRKRDAAHHKMVETYMDIIQKRREAGNTQEDKDMIWNLMNCVYKNGTQIPDKEIAHMMIALLMAGQHSSSSTSSWILLNIAAKPELNDELYAEQKEVFGDELRPLTYDDLSKMTLHGQVIKETLRLHAPIHSIMRKVKSPMPVNNTPYTIPTSHTVLSSPGVTARSPTYFPNPLDWQPHRWDMGADGTNMPDTTMEDEEKIDYGYGLATKGASSPYLPFGAGRHRCIGEQFAYVQLTTILAMFVREFKFSYKPGVQIPATDYSSLFSRPMTPSIIQWERREKA